MSLMTLIAFSSVTAIEALAVRQYATSWLPALSQPGNNTLPTVLRLLVQFGLLCAFFVLNYWGVRSFKLSNNVVTAFKFIVPALVVVILLTQLNPENFQTRGFAPFGFSGITAAITTGGIMFATWASNLSSASPARRGSILP